MRSSAQTVEVALSTFLSIIHQIRNSIMSLVRGEANRASSAADLPILSISAGASESDR